MRLLAAIPLLVLLPLQALAAPVTYSFTGHISSFTFDPPFPGAIGDTFSGTLTYDTDYQGTWLGDPWPAGKPALLDWNIHINGESYSLYSSPASPASNPLRAFNNDVIIESMFSASAGATLFNGFNMYFGFGSDLGGAVPDQLAVDDFTQGEFLFYGLPKSPGAQARGTIDTLSAVPLPASAWLMGSSLLGLLGAASRRRA